MRANPLFIPLSRLFFSTFSISLRNSWEVGRLGWVYRGRPGDRAECA